MKQTIAELGIGGEGWIFYKDYTFRKNIVHITVIDDYFGETITLTPKYLLREDIESNGVQATRDLVVSANEIVYSTKEEAEEELREEVSDTITSIKRDGVDWEKLLSELDSIQKQFEDITEDQKKDFCTFIKKLRNIADPQPDDINWNQVRINASISILNSLLETTKHSVLEEIAVNEIYAKTAVAYADSLVKELKRSEALFEEKLKEI